MASTAPSGREAHVALGRRRRVRADGQKRRRVLGVVVADPGALLDLRFRLGDRLAHLRRHQPRQIRPVAAQIGGDASHPLRPLAERDRSPAAERIGRAGAYGLDLMGARRLKGGEQLFRRRVDGLDFVRLAHHFVPAFPPPQKVRNDCAMTVASAAGYRCFEIRAIGWGRHPPPRVVGIILTIVFLSGYEGARKCLRSRIRPIDRSESGRRPTSTIHLSRAQISPRAVQSCSTKAVLSAENR